MIKNKEFLNFEDCDQYRNEILMALVDNGFWEYTRVGFGEDHNGLYVVDLDDTGEILREKLYVNPNFALTDVLAEGVECGVFERQEDGRYMVTTEAEVGSWGKFIARVI